MEEVWENFEGCNCLKLILIHFGYDNIASLKCINGDLLNDLEKHVEKESDMLQSLTCEHKDRYLSKTFEFLPGHRALILDWCLNGLTNMGESFNKNHSTFSPILRDIIGSALSNHGRPKHGHRYSEILVDFSIYLYIMAGRSCYETLSANLHLPKAVTILKRISSHKDRLIEGELRCQQLVQHLDRTNSPKSIFLSEDGSGIIKKVVYDSQTNQLIGLVLPIQEKNGMPILCSFKAESAEMIKTNIEQPKSTLVYKVVAEPLGPAKVPFILQIFGTDNKFETTDVLKRWMHTENELKRYGIEVVGWSSDGDNRLLSAMKVRTKFDLQPDLDLIKRADNESISFQDTIHIATKFRNRLLNSSIVLYFGNKIVSTMHVKTLIDTGEKSVHGLVQTDLYPEDRQNYRSLEKLMENRVLHCLKESIPDSEGTILFLSICKLITSAFVQENLDAKERIYNIWYAVYLLRCWRKFIISEDGYTLKENFISANAYTCCEINAQALVEMVVKLRSNGKPHLFKPLLFASQPCEHTFRTMRSMGTINFTKINFTLNELLHMVARVELLNKIIYSSEKIRFPDRFQSGTLHLKELPSDQDIMNTMCNARKCALEKAVEFGIVLSEEDILTTELQQSRELKANSLISSTEFDEILDEMGDEMDDEMENDILVDARDDVSSLVSNRISNLNILEEDLEEDIFAIKPAGTSNSEPSPELTVDVVSSDGTVKKIRKSTFVWMLSETNDKLSSDRLKRVQGSKDQYKSSASKKFKSNFNDVPNILKMNELHIGDWALFDIKSITIPTSFKDDFQNTCLIGNVIGFRRLDDKNRPKMYKVKYVSINQNDMKKIEILAIWYKFQDNAILKLCDFKLIIPFEKYLCTIKNPIIITISNKTNYVSQIEFTELNNYLEGLQCQI